MLIAMTLLACRPGDTPEPTLDTNQPASTGSSGETAADTGPAPARTILAEAPPHAVRVVVSPPHPGPVNVRCTSADDPLDDHALSGDASAPIVLRGLLAQTRYDCGVTDGAQEESFSLNTPPLTVDVRWTVVDHDPQRSAPGYTLFNHGRSDDDSPHQLILVDPEGRVRWSKIGRAHV